MKTIRKNILASIFLLLSPSMALAASELGSFTDPRDGKNYKTVKIGVQTWMAENLNYKMKGSYDRDIHGKRAKYGRYYEWGAAMKACPAGWHLPSRTEWKLLDVSTYSEGSGEYRGHKLKSTTGWKNKSYYGKGTDDYGFSAYPAGEYYDGNIYDEKDHTWFWSSTKATKVTGYNSNSGNWDSIVVAYVAELGDDTRIFDYGQYDTDTRYKPYKVYRKGYAPIEADRGYSVRCVQNVENAESIGSFEDSRDGKKYKTTKIGEQVWMAENLNYWTGSSECYDNNSKNCDQYGRLYDFKTALKVCPAGWHLPSEEEWRSLEKFIGHMEGFVLKSANWGEISQDTYSSCLKEKRSQMDFLDACHECKGYESAEKYGYEEGLGAYGFSVLPGGFKGRFGGGGLGGGGLGGGRRPTNIDYALMGAAAKFWAHSTESQSPYEKKQNKPPQKVRGWVYFRNRSDGFSIEQGEPWAEDDSIKYSVCNSRLSRIYCAEARANDSVKYSVRCVLGDPVFDDNGVVEDNEKIAPENKNKPAFDEEKCWGYPNGTFYCE